MKQGRFLPFLLLLLAAPVHAGDAPADAPARAHAPDFTLPARKGTVCLDSLRGKVVYVDFWASWCGPCRKSFPWLGAMQARYGKKGFQVVAVDLDKDRGAAEDFLDKYRPSFLVAFDPEGKTAEAYDVQAMPTSFLIDRTGALLYSRRGFDPREEGKIEALIQGALPQ